MMAGDHPPCGASIPVRAEDEGAIEALLTECRGLGLQRIRLVFPLCAAGEDAARVCYQRIVERAAASFEVVGAFARPEAQGRVPVRARDGANYLAGVVRLANAVGGHCDWFELADPLGPTAWPDHSQTSAALLADLVEWVGTPVALGGLPLDPAWLGAARDAGVLAPFGALAFPEVIATGVPAAQALATVRTVCERQGLWFTPDHSAEQPPHGERPEHRLARESEWLEASPARVFLPWAPETGAYAQNGASAGREHSKRLLRLGGAARLQRIARQAAASPPELGYDLITGGAGFVGSNLAARLAADGRSVLVFDSLARPGTEQNLEWLSQRFPGQIHSVLADVREREAVGNAVDGARRVFHLAAQVAVTTSLAQPRADHAVNVTGTLNVLEALRHCAHPPPLLLTSTNKVYGDLGGLDLRRGPGGYEPADAELRSRGIDEDMPLALSSPYGCSKGAADQYAVDYARSFGLPSVVFRMSCVYGPRQFGNEDQGWVAHFTRRALRGEPISLYGDGYQVRDLLYIDDLVAAMLVAMDHLPGIAGRAFNIGGGAERALSLLGLLQHLERLNGVLPPVQMADWRAGDQRYYVSDSTRFRNLTGWSPRVDVPDGVGRLYHWMQAHEGVGNAPVTADDRIAL